MRRPSIHVEVAGRAAGLDGPVSVRIGAGARLADALAAAGAKPNDSAHLGIWGRRASADTPLHEGDRIECYRALEVDPKRARRSRARRGRPQGKR